MKKMFFEYVMEENIDNILQDSLIILDTNALLMLYRLNDENRKKYFDVLDVVKDRVYLTNQSAKEFFKNRLIICNNKLNLSSSVEEEIVKDLEKIKNKVSTCQFTGNNKGSSSLLVHEDKLQKKIIESIERTIDETKEILNTYEVNINKNFSSKDEILDEILNLFENKVNEAFKDDEIKEIYVEGKDRYEKQIPPGYKDLDKGDNSMYGDFIIWKEIIEIAKRENKNILFVSDDRKEDWCEKFKGKDLGPRKELIREFYELTSKLFYSLKTTNFIKSISELYKIERTEDLQKESKNISEYLSKNGESSVYKVEEDINSNSNIWYDSLCRGSLGSIKLNNNGEDFIKFDSDRHINNWPEGVGTLGSIKLNNNGEGVIKFDSDRHINNWSERVGTLDGIKLNNNGEGVIKFDSNRHINNWPEGVGTSGGIKLNNNGEGVIRRDSDRYINNWPEGVGTLGGIKLNSNGEGVIKFDSDRHINNWPEGVGTLGSTKLNINEIFIDDLLNK